MFGSLLLQSALCGRTWISSQYHLLFLVMFGNSVSRIFK